MRKPINEAMKAKILENIPAIISLHDTEQNIMWGNKAYCEVAGLAEHQLIGKKCWVAWGLAGPCQNCPVAAAMETGRPAEAELCSEKQDHWLESKGSWLLKAVPFKDDKGTIVGAIEVAIEISKPTQEKKIEGVEGRFRAIAECALDALILIDDEGKVAYWNPAAEKMFGYSAAEITGQDVHDILIPEKYRGRFEKGLRYFIKKGKVPVDGKVVELTAKHRSGEQIPVEIIVIPIQKQVKFWAVAVIRDLAEHKKLKMALGLRNEQLQAILDKIPVMLAIFDPHGRILLLNREFERILGWRKEEAEKTDLMKEIYPDAEHRKKAWAYMMSVSPEWRDFKFKAKNGEMVDCAWSHMRLSDETLIGVGIDIRDRKKSKKRMAYQIKLLSTLYDSAQKLTEKVDPVARAKEVVRTSVEAFGVSLSWLGRKETDGSVRILAHWPENFSCPQQISVRWDESPEGKGPTGRAIRSGLPQITEDISNDPGFCPWKDATLSSRTIASSVALPLISGGRAFGVLNLYSNQIGFFTEELLTELQGFAHMAASALNTAQLYVERNHRIQRITALRNIDMAIAGSLDLRIVTRVALDEIVKQLGVDAAAILQLNPHTLTLEYLNGKGFYTKEIEKSRMILSDGAAAMVTQERKVVHIADLTQTSNKVFLHREPWAKEGFVSYYGVPLVAKGELLGVLEIFNRHLPKEDTEWNDFLLTLAGQVAIAIDSAGLVDKLRHEHDELINAYNETIEGWGTALSLKEEETAEHSHRVTEMTVRIAGAMGKRKEELNQVRLGALLHDIGKIGIPDSILLKPGKLTSDEWEIMRKHPVYAFEMLAPIAYLSKASEIPYCHHERWDGKGYPRGLKQNQIPLAARIFAVVDVWDALICDRPYRKAWPQEQVLEHIQKQSGSHFDPKVVEYFLKITNEEE